MDNQRSISLFQFMAEEGLVLSLEEEEKRKNVIQKLKQLEGTQGFCDPNPTEYVDNEKMESNVVFYWGLHPNNNFMDIGLVKREFMKIINNGYEGIPGRIELSILLASFSAA